MTDLELKCFHEELEKMAFLGFGGGDKPKPGPTKPGMFSSISDPIKNTIKKNVSAKTLGGLKMAKGVAGKALGPAFALWEGMAARKSVLQGSALYEGMLSAKDMARNMRR